VNNQIHWDYPFSEEFGSGMVHRQFTVGSTIYAVGFEQILTMDDFTRKGVDILNVHPTFRFPLSGVWGVIFDEIDPVEMDFKGFRHIQHQGLAGGQVLLNVASIIFEVVNKNWPPS